MLYVHTIKLQLIMHKEYISFMQEPENAVAITLTSIGGLKMYETLGFEHLGCLKYILI